jgi:hypothetical protein
MEQISMEMFGNLEDGPTDDRMIVRILGHRVGSAGGWFYCSGHCIMMPEFEMEPGLLKFAPDLKSVPKNTGLMIDYYAGLLALIPHSAKGSGETMPWQPIWTGQFKLEV